MSGSIEGQVLNQRDGKPLEGADLTLAGEGAEKQQSTAKGGLFDFPGLAAGKYELVASKPGFDNGDFGPLAVVDGVSTKITIALRPKA